MQVAKWGVNRMPRIEKAWKGNVNVWKWHQTLQSVFNHGECMMHVDKNVDSHVVDQNVDQISREIAYVRLGGGLGPNVVHACIFFFLEWVQDMLTWGHENMEILVMCFWGPKVLDPGSCF